MEQNSFIILPNGVPIFNFLAWVKHSSKKNGKPSIGIVDGVRQGFYIPDIGIFPKLSKWLGLGSTDLYNLISTDIANAFSYLWDSRHFNELGVRVDNNKFVIAPDGTKIRINTHFDLGDLTQIFVEGMLSLPHLTEFIRNIKNHANVNNPLFISATRNNINKVTILPDLDLIHSLLEKFKVRNLLELTLSDFNNVFNESYTIDILLRLIVEDEDPIGITDKIGQCYFIDRLPHKTMNKLEQLIVNKSNAKGDIGEISRDVLQLITAGHLKGKDLISLCVSNPKINKICNANDQALFKRALKREFNIEFKVGLFDHTSARKMYFQAHKFCWVLNYQEHQSGGLNLTKIYEFGTNANVARLQPNKYTGIMKLFIPSPEFTESFELARRVVFINFRENSDLTVAYITIPNTDTYTFCNHEFVTSTDNLSYLLLLFMLADKETNQRGSNSYHGHALSGLKEMGFENNVVDFIWVELH